MSDRIRLLPEVVANQIAAGEVVNHPSSVVKEMMENAIDAGAQTVKVNYRDGGKELIQIVDDGCGMSPVDARMAFDRHATSKIRSVDDIYALSTFGFRGEALASIAAVAQVELRTRQEGDAMGTSTEINGGQFVAQNPVMCPVGSQFFVRNLFYNVPARRRFLEKSTVAASQIRTEFQRVALCNPRVAFELHANDKLLSSLPVASLAGRIVDVVGRHIRHNLLEVQADTSIARIEGYIGLPAAAKRSRSEQYLFVNGRYFKSSYLSSAILKAYEKLIPENSQPAYFLYLSIDASRIDVNVHPQKTEVKFADEEAVWQIVNAAVRETLAKTGAIPPMDFDREETVEIPVLDRRAVYSEPRAMSNSSYNPFLAEYVDPSAPDPNVDFAGFDVPYGEQLQSVSDASAEDFRTIVAAPSGGRGAAAASSLPSFPSPSPFPAEGGFEGFSSAIGGEFEEFASGDDASEDVPSEAFGESRLDFIPSQSEAEQQRLDIGQPVAFGDPLPLGGGYAAALLDGRLVVVDLRRARERVVYEDYIRRAECSSSPGQQLLFPERLVLSGDEYALLEEHAVEFAALGFDLELQGGGEVEVRGIPADAEAGEVDRLLFDLLQAYSTPVSLGELRREKIAAAMAHGAARSALRNPSREEIAALLSRLAATGNISFTPSGKTVLTEFTMEDIRTRLG